MAQKKFLIAFFSVFSLALLAVLPFFGRGFLPTHDGEYHLIRFMEFDRMLRGGYLFPRWAPTINSGYGLPLFEFMYPMVNYIASSLHLIGMEFVSTFKISTALGYLSAAIFCFLWLRKRFGLYPAVIGTIAASYVPYWFVEMYVRGTIGEVWAVAFVFAFLFFVENKSFVLGSFALAGIILSHNILAMLFFPLLVTYAVWRSSWKWLLTVVCGMGIAAWFWLPAITESRYMAGLNTVNFRDHFASVAELLIPSWGTEFSGENGSGNLMSLQIGIGPLLWLLSGLGMGIARWGLKKTGESAVWLLVMVTAIVMTLPISLPLWETIKVLQLTQYPWRFLVYSIPVVAYIAAYTARSIKHRWITLVLTFMTVLLSFSYTRGVVYAPRSDAYYSARSNFTDGTSSMGNSLSTIWAPWKQRKPVSALTDTKGEVISYSALTDRYLHKTYEVTQSKPENLRINVLYFPGWTVTVDGSEALIDYRTNGTLDFRMPSGTHVINAVMRETPVRVFADILSVVSLVSLIGWGILRYRRRQML